MFLYLLASYRLLLIDFLVLGGVAREFVDDVLKTFTVADLTVLLQELIEKYAN